MGSQPEYEFLFVVDGISVDDDSTVTIITDIFDGLLSWNRGLHRLAVSSNGVDAWDAFQGLLRHLAAAIPALRILRLDPDLVGISDIAERTGHSRQNVQQWVAGERNAERPFPPPEGSAGRSLVWQWADVNEWLKPLGLDDQAARPTREESVFINATLIDRNNGFQPHSQMPAADRAALASPAPAARGSTARPSSWSARASGFLHSPEGHRALLARIPLVTGRGLADWFTRLESGPGFLRLDEQTDWLSDEHGLSRGYASAIVHEYELRRRERLSAGAGERAAVPKGNAPAPSE